MACMIIVVAASLTQQTPTNTRRNVDWREIQAQAEQHRERIRMCGPLSVARALAILNHSVDVESWLHRFASDRSDGVPIRDVILACREFEPQARLVRVSNRSTASLNFPCILIVNDGRHCVVAESRSGENQLRVWDPSIVKHVLLSEERLDELWDGDVIDLGTRSRLGLAVDVSLSIAAIVLLAIVGFQTA